MGQWWFQGRFLINREMRLPAVPMFADYNISIFQTWFEAFVDLGSKASLREGSSILYILMDVSHMLPAVEEAFFVLLVEAIVYWYLIRASKRHKLFQMGNGVLPSKVFLRSKVHLALRVEEIIVGINDHDCCIGEGSRHVRELLN